MVTVLLFLIGLTVGGAGVFVYSKYLSDSTLKDADNKAKKLLSEAGLQAENTLKSAEIKAKDEMLKLRKDFEDEARGRRNELNQIEQRLTAKEARLDERQKNIDEKERNADNLKTNLEKQKQKLDETIKQQTEKLEKVAQLTQDEAKKQLMNNLEQDLKVDAAKKIKEYEENVRRLSDAKAKDIIALAIKRCAVDNVVEATTSTVNLPNEDMKGRIIGREGRNIRAFEQITGIDLIIDDTPETVILSGFDPIRREIARLTLISLLKDGRIHPARVEETVEKVRKELIRTIREEGERVATELEMPTLPPKMYELIGRLKYRTSYGQNCLQHSIEVAHLSSFIAQELGVNYRLAMRAGLLHDIGKAIDFEQEGTHAQIGVMILRKLGEAEDVMHAVAAHHEEVQPQTVEALIVLVADALSAARPGARSESVESYIKRLVKLEAIANSFAGVEKSFAIQAGREVRVMVKPDDINDEGAAKIAHDIAKKIETEMEYPGQIKISVIRETRFQEVAK